MINYFYETTGYDVDERAVSSWLEKVLISEEKKLGEINYIFCDDEYLLQINQDFLNHDTYTDIISFGNGLGNIVAGDIFVSLERVSENADHYGVSFVDELRRVIVHGVLHFCGYKDKTKEEEILMRQKENEKLKMFHVEHL
ncbi:rRNA maturation RNase YbeY [Aquimarina sp. MMG015]|uniref:rRNA maturation RNase YbeY n=1 Tax=Aquimarina TaxID=290174 RepID=UPI000429CF66|nr:MULTISPECIES: rRNA maturation RNase YbeY [Aquimarina]AXT57303.1 rRNA maturation RNase YbeY [Aquimarina sp. AD1]MBQ4801454.1 rRNA maturation RNase YbeY [Aquimarina sp. MMG015]RKN09117.1 rRNA maturation RNase YbeY [Aquimarina sp. AD1]